MREFRRLTDLAAAVARQGPAGMPWNPVPGIALFGGTTMSATPRRSPDDQHDPFSKHRDRRLFGSIGDAHRRARRSRRRDEALVPRLVSGDGLYLLCRPSGGSCQIRPLLPPASGARRENQGLNATGTGRVASRRCRPGRAPGQTRGERGRRFAHGRPQPQSAAGVRCRPDRSRIFW